MVEGTLFRLSSGRGICESLSYAGDIEGVQEALKLAFC